MNPFFKRDLFEMKASANTKLYYLVFFITGFTAIAGQIIFVREFFSLFTGNELFLGSFFALWLMWTALGSYLAGRPFFNTKQIFSQLAWLQTASALLLPMTLYLIRRSPPFWHPAVGELPGFVPTLFTSIVLLAPFCLINGALFTSGSRLLRSKKQLSLSKSAGTVYWLETAASALGGVLMAAAVIIYFRPGWIIAGLSLMNLFSAFILFLPRKYSRLFAAALAFLMLVTLPRWSAWYNLFPGFQLLQVKDSPYGRLTVLQQAENTIVLENGRLAYSRLDRLHAESLAHPAMLLHGHPQQVLFIGGGFSGALTEALKYPALRKLDYVELDPDVLEIGRRYFPDIWQKLTGDKRVTIYRNDGLRFLKSTNKQYDVIIIDLPDPLNAQLNRFYTVEFFELVRRHLKPAGIFSFFTRGAENYFSPPLARLVGCEYHSLRKAFNFVAFIPGNPLYYLASDDSLLKHFSAQLLIKRLRQKQIQTRYVNAAFLPYRLSAERLADLEQTITAQQEAPLNNDLKPQAYYYNLTLQGAQRSARFVALLRHLSHIPFAWYLTPVFLLPLLLYCVRQRRLNSGQMLLFAGYSLFVMGFSVMALEIILLILYQIAFGSLYLEIALLIAAMMGGMALGSWLALRRPPGNLSSALIILHVVSAGLAPLLFVLAKNDVGEASYFLLAAMAGMIGGAIFPLAAKLYLKEASNMGAPYSIDLSGAFFSSLFFSAILIPLYGFYHAAWLLMLLNLSVSILFILADGSRFTLLRKQKR